VSADPRVNSDEETGSMNPPEDGPERPRWWIRRPAMGIVASAVLGVAAFLVTLTIGTPASDPGMIFTNLVILPIALLLPAIALGGAMVAWHAFGQTCGRQRLMLAFPAAIGLLLNSAAIAVFTKWVVQVLSP